MNLQEDQEKKKLEQAQKKAEAKALLEKEMADIKKTAAKVAPPPKITRAQIEKKIAAAPAKPEKPVVETHLDVPLEENVNRLTIDGEEARSVMEAIAVLEWVLQHFDFTKT